MQLPGEATTAMLAKRLARQLLELDRDLKDTDKLVAKRFRDHPHLILWMFGSIVAAGPAAGGGAEPQPASSAMTLTATAAASARCAWWRGGPDWLGTAATRGLGRGSLGCAHRDRSYNPLHHDRPIDRGDLPAPPPHRFGHH